MNLDGWRIEIHRRIDCPVSWCAGRWLQHGGDGAEPEDWVHDEETAILLPHGAQLTRSQVGAGPTEWSLLMPGDGGASFSLEPMSPQAYAAWLRDIATAINASGSLGDEEDV